MNTEPPEGDDLQRMLVSMKQNVLERATPRPKRRRVRPGIALGIVGLLAVGTATGAVALTLSQQQEQPVAAPTQTQQPEPAPTATTPSSAPITGAPTPKPTPTPTSPAPPATDVRLPGDCYLLVPDDDYDRFFGAARHESMIIAPGGDREPEGNDRIQGLRGEHEVLSCTWQNEGVEANLTLAVGHVVDFGPGMSEDMVERRGGTCSDRLGGWLCQSAGPSGGGGTLTTTRFERDDIVIAINQTDFPTDGLLDAVVGEIWGD